jgi:uncharacterized membrane protein
MIQVLLHLLGTKVPAAQHIADWTLTFRYAEWGRVWLAGLVLTGAAIWFYRRSRVAMPALGRYGMAGLRGILFVLLLGLAMQPVVQLGIVSKVRQGLAVVFDGSASLAIPDQRVTEADLKRAALAQGLLDPAGGLGQSFNPAGHGNLAQLRREELVRGPLVEQVLGQLAKQYDLQGYRFGQTVTELPATNQVAGWFAQLRSDSPVTPLGDALREVLRRQRGQSVAGVVLITDGANNAGSPPVDAAALARQEHRPLYIYGVGITSPKDIVVGNLFSEDVAFVKDELNVVVRVRAQGLAGERAQLRLRLGPQVVAEQAVVFEADAEQVVELRVKPERTGEFELAASIEPRGDELVKDNNTQVKKLRVVDTKIQVLLIEQSPRWEYRYLQAMLARDRRVELKVLLFEADAGLAQGADTPYLPGFPKLKEDLFRYDVIVLGDVDPKLLAGPPLEWLRDYVAKFGGALVMVAGKRFSPAAYAGTPLSAALPVEVEKLSPNRRDEELADKPIALELTPAGKESPMLQLADTPLASQKVWRELPPIYWVARVGGVRPAAEVLVAAADSRPGAREKVPVLVIQRYGLGQTLFMGTDSTWRWRKNAGDRYFTLLWGQIVQRMSLARLLGEAKRTQLTSDRQSYRTGDKVTVYARLYSATYEPINEPVIQGRFSDRHAAPTGNGSAREVTLRPLPGQPGMYRGEFVAPGAGAYKFVVDRDAETQLDFMVQETRFEFGQTEMNAPLLQELAAVSGGAFLREEDLYRLPELVGQQVETVRTTIEVEVWSSPLVFTLLVLVVGLEWWLRKRWQLK